jgi:hypothetical protein
MTTVSRSLKQDFDYQDALQLPPVNNTVGAKNSFVIAKMPKSSYNASGFGGSPDFRIVGMQNETLMKQH